MNIINNKIKQNKGVALLEYTVLAGLIGVISVSSVVKLGDYIADSNEQASVIISENITASTPVALALTLADIRNAPYAPSARVEGRVYEDFVIVMNFDNSANKWNFSTALASSYNPAQIVPSAPSGLVSGPFDASGSAYALCVLASTHAGQIADPSKSMFAPVFNGVASDVEISKVVYSLKDSEISDANSVVYFDDVNSPSSTSTAPWASVSKPFNTLFSFTCSRPQ